MRINDKTAFRVLLVVIAMALFLAFWGLIWPGDVWGDTLWTHAGYGYTVDSLKWVYFRDGIFQDSAGKIFSVTQWPATTFVVQRGYHHNVVFYSWKYGNDSVPWHWGLNTKNYDVDSCVGMAGYSVKLYAIDTSGTDQAVAWTKITIRNAANQNIQYAHTLGDGARTFFLDSGSYTCYAHIPGYQFDAFALTVTADIGSTAVNGYNINITSPLDPTLVAVVADFSRLSGVKDIIGVCLEIYEEVGQSKYSVDTVGGAKIILPLVERVCSDTTGRVTGYAIKSSDIGDTSQGFYTIDGKLGDRLMFHVEGMYITGDINIGDSLAVR